MSFSTPTAQTECSMAYRKESFVVKSEKEE